MNNATPHGVALFLVMIYLFRVDPFKELPDFTAKPPAQPLGKNAVFAIISVDYQWIILYNDLHLPLGNGKVSESSDKLLALVKC